LFSINTLPLHLQNSRENDAFASLPELGFEVGYKEGHRLLKGKEEATDVDLVKAIPYMQVLAVEILDLSRTKVINLEPLKGLLNLKSLNLMFTGVLNPEQLKGLPNVSISADILR
jgi:hypothetical protein